MIKKDQQIGEILIILIASLFLGFILALRLKWPMLSFEPINFLFMFILSLLIVCVFVCAQKIIAYKLDCNTNIKLLSFKRYWFGPIGRISPELPFRFPLWLVLPLLLFFLTSGFVKWLAILDLDIEAKPTKIRRRLHALEEADTTKILMSGPLAVLGLAVVSKILGLITTIQGFTDFATICSLFAFLTLIPIGLGFKLLVSSRFIWLFLLVFSAVMLTMMKLQNLVAIIAIALIFAAIVTISYYILYEKS